MDHRNGQTILMNVVKSANFDGLMSMCKYLIEFANYGE